jgi:hypothetical protein
MDAECCVVEVHRLFDDEIVDQVFFEGRVAACEAVDDVHERLELAARIRHAHASRMHPAGTALGGFWAS